MSIEDAIKVAAEKVAARPPSKKPRKKPRIGKAREMPKGLLPRDVKWGPAMAALSDKRKLFVLLMANMPGQPHGLSTRCAREAGFGTTESSPGSMASISSMLVHDEKIQAAMLECGKRGLVSLGLRGLKRLGEICEDDAHKDNFKAANALVNAAYSNPAAVHLHQHAHVDVSGESTLERCRVLAGRIGVDLDMLLRANNPARAIVQSAASPMRTIEGVADAPAPLADRAVHDFINREKEQSP